MLVLYESLEEWSGRSTEYLVLISSYTAVFHNNTNITLVYAEK
jgi:hypothetical protein